MFKHVAGVGGIDNGCMCGLSRAVSRMIRDVFLNVMFRTHQLFQDEPFGA